MSTGLEEDYFPFTAPFIFEFYDSCCMINTDIIIC